MHLPPTDLPSRFRCSILVAVLVSLTVTSIVGARTGRMNMRRTLTRMLVVGIGTLTVSYLVGKLVF